MNAIEYIIEIIRNYGVKYIHTYYVYIYQCNVITTFFISMVYIYVWLWILYTGTQPRDA